MKNLDPMGEKTVVIKSERSRKGTSNWNKERLQNYFTIQVQRDDFAENINRQSETPPHTVSVHTHKTEPYRSPPPFQIPIPKTTERERERETKREGEMGGAAQAMKRIPRIKFPQRHPKPSGSESEIQAPAKDGNATQTFFSGLKASTTLGGKASLQPKRTLVSNEEIEAILLGGCI